MLFNTNDRECFSDNDIKDDMAGSTAVVVIMKDGKIFCVSDRFHW